MSQHEEIQTLLRELELAVLRYGAESEAASSSVGPGLGDPRAIPVAAMLGLLGTVWQSPNFGVVASTLSKAVEWIRPIIDAHSGKIREV